MRSVQNSPKIGFHPYLRRSVLEEVCVYNNGVLEVSTSRSTTSSSNSSNNNTTIISSKLICFNKQIDLFNVNHPTAKQVAATTKHVCCGNIWSLDLIVGMGFISKLWFGQSLQLHLYKAKHMFHVRHHLLKCSAHDMHAKWSHCNQWCFANNFGQMGNIP